MLESENKKPSLPQWLGEFTEYLNKPLPPLRDIDLPFLLKRNTPALSTLEGTIVSIVIPAWNEEEYIAHTLEALRNQTFPRKHTEIIVVDNASTDRTAELARIYGADKVVSESRKGTNFARQRGIDESAGDIVAFLDADCVPPSEWVEKMYVKLSSRQNRCAAIAGSYIFCVNPIDSLFLGQEIYRWLVMPTMATLFGRMLGKGGVLIGGNFASFRENFQKLTALIRRLPSLVMMQVLQRNLVKLVMLNSTPSSMY